MMKSVRVGPFDVRIEHLTGMDHDNRLGDYSTTDLLIRLREKYCSEQQRAETLLHEIIHAVWDVYGIKAKEGEERAVGLLSIALSAVIRDNPELIAWLTKSLK